MEKLKKETLDILKCSTNEFLKLLQTLCLNVHKISSSLTNIETKLNSVLEGPNYELGNTIMKECEKDFKVLSKQK